MSKKEKLLKRLLSYPKDFTFDEAETLLSYYGFVLSNKGKTSGSRVKFVSNKTGLPLLLHKPHPSNILKPYQLEDIINKIQEEVNDEIQRYS